MATTTFYDIVREVIAMIIASDNRVDTIEHVRFTKFLKTMEDFFEKQTGESIKAMLDSIKND